MRVASACRGQSHGKRGQQSRQRRGGARGVCRSVRVVAIGKQGGASRSRHGLRLRDAEDDDSARHVSCAWRGRT
ncbi:hypothetical protein XFF6992_230050 [Xanthomonas citri pv. fuscans]|nr:hypothetical protein XFF6992_230050 [Xanthomonas citri pv. fuscans]SOO32264.1 hypothetical protein XFF6994_1810003 [Xanthomonas citri pv. fuscans]